MSQDLIALKTRSTNLSEQNLENVGILQTPLRPSNQNSHFPLKSYFTRTATTQAIDALSRLTEISVNKISAIPGASFFTFYCDIVKTVEH